MKFVKKEEQTKNILRLGSSKTEDQSNNNFKSMYKAVVTFRRH